MTEAEYLAWIRSSLRSKWLRWPSRGEALKKARKAYNGPNKLQKWVYECALCKGHFKAKELDIDHYPVAAGSILSVQDIGPFAERLYCDTNNLRVLCKPCHKVHTLAEQRGISFQEALIVKQLIAFEKMTAKQQDETLRGLSLPVAKLKKDRQHTYETFVRGQHDNTERS